MGERNYRWFLAFLYLNALLMAYGVWAALAVLLHDIESLKLLTAVFTKGGKQVRATYSIVGQYLLGSRTEVCMVGALCVVMGVLVLAFALYHTCLAGSSLPQPPSPLPEAQEQAAAGTAAGLGRGGLSSLQQL